MPISLFVEEHDDGIAFYLNGDLQFDTADETIYHEYLVIPAISLTIQRFPQTDLRVLVCGGGDGLAVRDILRFESVKQIALVDYNSEVLELAQTKFKPYNLGSLEKENVTVYAQEAFDFVSELADESYHAVICDFTYPNSLEETKIYSHEWFKEIKRILIPDGIICTNSVSPEKNTTGFWCLYQTLQAANLLTKPFQINIPSFRWHDYGNWGFLIASSKVITKDEIETISLPDNLQSLVFSQLLESFIFESAIADIRHQVMIHTLESPCLFYYLLNYTSAQKDLVISSGYINFLEIEDAITLQVGADCLNLKSVTNFWLENIYSNQITSENSVEINRFLPARHRYHSPKMTSAWLTYVTKLLSEIDSKQLLNSLLARVEELPPQIASDLKKLAEKINSNQPLTNITPKNAEFITILSVTLLMANLATPDTIFAKGNYQSNYDNYDINQPNYLVKAFGLMLALSGGIWLFKLLFPRKTR